MMLLTFFLIPFFILEDYFTSDKSCFKFASTSPGYFIEETTDCKNNGAYYKFYFPTVQGKYNFHTDFFC